VVHETKDPEVVIAEYDYDGLVTTTGRSFQVANIQVSRIREGQIVASRDYHNHPVLADAVAQRLS
jgi:ketosteroid isomerase-like protein